MSAAESGLSARLAAMLQCVPPRGATPAEERMDHIYDQCLPARRADAWMALIRVSAMVTPATDQAPISMAAQGT